MGRLGSCVSAPQHLAQDPGHPPLQQWVGSGAKVCCLPRTVLCCPLSGCLQSSFSSQCPEVSRVTHRECQRCGVGPSGSQPLLHPSPHLLPGYTAPSLRKLLPVCRTPSEPAVAGSRLFVVGV